MELLTLFGSFMKYTGETWAIVLGAIALCLHFFFKYRASLSEEHVHEEVEKHNEIDRLSKEIHFLVEENRKLRAEILDLRETYVSLHERYLEALKQCQQCGKSGHDKEA